MDNYEELNSHYLPFGPEYVIFGDIHGCYDEFISLLGKHGFEISSSGRISHIQDGKTIVLVGDILDKGYDIAKVINLVSDLVIDCSDRIPVIHASLPFKALFKGSIFLTRQHSFLDSKEL